MSEAAVETPPEGTEGDGYTPPATQQELNRIIAERVKREQAKYADYKDLQGKASEYDKLAEANKTEVQRAQERIAAAEAEVAAVPSKVAEALKAHLVTLHDIGDEDAELFLTANDPDLLLKQVGRLVGRQAESKKQGNHVPREGANTPPSKSGDEREFVRNLFANTE